MGMKLFYSQGCLIGIRREHLPGSYLPNPRGSAFCKDGDPERVVTSGIHTPDDRLSVVGEGFNDGAVDEDAQRHLAARHLERSSLIVYHEGLLFKIDVCCR